jgi:hypothetical protein
MAKCSVALLALAALSLVGCETNPEYSAGAAPAATTPRVVGTSPSPAVATPTVPTTTGRIVAIPAPAATAPAPSATVTSPPATVAVVPAPVASPMVAYKPGRGTIESIAEVNYAQPVASASAGAGSPAMSAYRLGVRMEDGTVQYFDQDQSGFRVGDRVQITGDGRILK